ncbi:GvpL/GvpF family gas vesicle protein [Streptomyces sp. NPDC004726]
MSTDASTDVVYAYAVALDAEGLRERTKALRGVHDAPVRLVRGGPGRRLAAAVSSVPASQFGQEELKAHLEDLAWLEETARAHHDVIEALYESTSVLPLRLGTVYLEDAGVTRVLDTEGGAFLKRLARLADHVEWGVKVYVEGRSPQEPPEPVAEPPEESPGRAYLQGRRTQQRSRDETWHNAMVVARRIEDVGRAYASGWARHRVQQGELARGPGQNVINDAYLVPLERAERFRAEASRAAEGLEGVRIEVTGPWAPYSFASPSETSAAGDPAASTPS